MQTASITSQRPSRRRVDQIRLRHHRVDVEHPLSSVLTEGLVHPRFGPIGLSAGR
jgi:hypothetical protein